jgi:hypothetical protein
VSVAGWFALIGLIVGYVLSGSLLLTAVTKPFIPDRVGLWRTEDDFSLHLGFAQPGPGIEMLGWWIVPIGLIGGAAGMWLTTRLARWAIRGIRRTMPVPTR